MAYFLTFYPTLKISDLKYKHMAGKVTFTLKEDEQGEIAVRSEDIAEIVPDADFRFSLLILKNGDKHFVCGTKEGIENKIGANASS